MVIEEGKLISVPQKDKVFDKDKDKRSLTRKELIDALKSLEGVKRRLKKALDSA